MSTTESGRTCQRWDSQEPHAHTHCAERDCSTDENYCRNPDRRALGAWCSTTDPTMRFEKCDLGPPSSSLLCDSIEIRPEVQSVFMDGISQHVASSSEGLSASHVTSRVVTVQHAATARIGRRRLQSQMLGTSHSLCVGIRVAMIRSSTVAVVTLVALFTELSFSVAARVDCQDVMTSSEFYGALADSASEWCPQ